MAITESGRYCTCCGGRLARDNNGERCGACRYADRDALLKPPVVPRTFWESGQVRDALATWHMGRVIYAYRTHPHHGRPLSQERIGGWLGLTQAQLSRIENGRAPEELSKLVRYAKIIGIPGDLLWFKLPDDVPAMGHAPASYGIVAHTLPADDADDLEHVAAALDDARRYLDGSVVDYFRGQLRRGKADDGDAGPGKALPLVLSILGAISEHARDVKPSVRPALLSLAADGAEFAGWLYRDLQDGARAAYWYDRAMELAQQANDTATQGYVLLKKSQMAYDTRNAFRVSSLAQAAQRGPWQFPAKVRAEVTQQEAVGLAMLGEPMGAVEQKIDQARVLFASAAPDDGQDSPAGAYFTADTLLLRCATCYTEAGKPAQAAAIFDGVIASGTLSRRDAGFFRARRAAALALSGEPDEAAATGLEAARIAKETNSQRTIWVLAEVVRALAPWSSRPGPRALREAVSA